MSIEEIIKLTLPVNSNRDHIQGPSTAPITLLEYGNCGNSTFRRCFASRYNLDIKAKFLATFSQMVTIPSEHDKI